MTWWIREDLYMFLKCRTRTHPKSCSTFLVKRQIRQLPWRTFSKCFCSSGTVLACPDPFRLICLGLRNPQTVTLF